MIQFAKIVQIEQNTKFSTLFLQTKKTCTLFLGYRSFLFVISYFVLFSAALFPRCAPDGTSRVEKRRFVPIADICHMRFFTSLCFPSLQGRSRRWGFFLPPPLGRAGVGLFSS